MTEDKIKDKFDEFKDFGNLVSRMLKVPSVFINAIGPMQPMAGLLGKIMKPSHFMMRGFSQISDAEGKTLVRISEKQGVILSKITLENEENPANS